MIVGCIIGIIVLGLIGWTIWMTLYCGCYEKVGVAIFVVMIASGLVGGGALGASFDNTSVEEDIAGFSVIKQTYESAIHDENLSGYERIAIINTVIEQNKLLARRQASITKWWNFGITQENKDALLALTPIQ